MIKPSSVPNPDYTDSEPSSGEYAVIALFAALLLAIVGAWYLIKLSSDHRYLDAPEYTHMVRWMRENPEFVSHLGALKDYQLATNLWLGNLHRYRINHNGAHSEGYFIFYVKTDHQHGFYRFDFIFDATSAAFIEVIPSRVDL